MIFVDGDYNRQKIENDQQKEDRKPSHSIQKTESRMRKNFSEKHTHPTIFDNLTNRQSYANFDTAIRNQSDQ